MISTAKNHVNEIWSGFILTFLAAQIALLLWASDKGLDLSDESFYIIGYLQGIKIYGIQTFFSLYQAFLEPFSLTITEIRYLRIVLSLLTATIFYFGVVRAIEMRCQTNNTTRLNLFIIISMTLLASYQIGPLTISYNHFSQILGLTIIGLSLIQQSTKHTIPFYTLTLFIGISYGFLALSKLPNIFLLPPGIFLIQLILSRERKSFLNKRFFVNIAIIGLLAVITALLTLGYQHDQSSIIQIANEIRNPDQNHQISKLIDNVGIDIKVIWNNLYVEFILLLMFAMHYIVLRKNAFKANLLYHITFGLTIFMISILEYERYGMTKGSYFIWYPDDKIFLIYYFSVFTITAIIPILKSISLGITSIMNIIVLHSLLRRTTEEHYVEIIIFLLIIGSLYYILNLSSRKAHAHSYLIPIFIHFGYITYYRPYLNGGYSQYNSFEPFLYIILSGMIISLYIKDKKAFDKLETFLLLLSGIIITQLFAFGSSNSYYSMVLFYLPIFIIGTLFIIPNVPKLVSMSLTLIIGLLSISQTYCGVIQKPYRQVESLLKSKHDLQTNKYMDIMVTDEFLKVKKYLSKPTLKRYTYCLSESHNMGICLLGNYQMKPYGWYDFREHLNNKNFTQQISEISDSLIIITDSKNTTTLLNNEKILPLGSVLIDSITIYDRKLFLIVEK